MFSLRIPRKKSEDNTKVNLREEGRKDIRCMEAICLEIFFKLLCQDLLEILDIINIIYPSINCQVNHFN